MNPKLKPLGLDLLCAAEEYAEASARVADAKHALDQAKAAEARARFKFNEKAEAALEAASKGDE